MNIARELSRRLRVADRVIASASRPVAQRYVMESRRRRLPHATSLTPAAAG